MPNKHALNERKLREMILYFANMSFRDDSFGATRLNKLLFNADFRAYQLWGKSISGATYKALKFGPAPANMDMVVSHMKRDGELAIRQVDYHGKPQKKPIPLRSQEFDDSFSVEEKNLMFEVLNQYWSRSATSVSEESHEFLGWLAANEGEEIPYAVSLIDTREPSLDEIKRGLELETMALECLAANATRKAPRDNRRA
jgi:hypothetical protein